MKSAIVAELARVVGPEFESLGFKSSRHEKLSYTKEFPSGLSRIDVLVADYAILCRVELGVAIRFHDVERFVTKIENTIVKSSRPSDEISRATIGSNVRAIADDDNLYWDLYSTKDVVDTAPSIIGAVEEFIIPYCLQYSSEVKTYTALRQNEILAGLLVPFPSERARRTLALAILLKQPRLEVEQLIEELDSYLQRIDQRQAQSFREFAEATKSTTQGII